jgi:hypothetical protein
MKQKLTPEQRAENSRRNGAKSKGPVTPEGKARSSKNAITHGIYAGNVITGSEDPEAYLRLLDDCLVHFRPADDYERSLVVEIADARWRISRLVGLETAYIDCAVERQREAVDEEFDVVDEGIRVTLAFTGYDGRARSGIGLLGRTEGRLHRILMRNTAELRRMQADRRAADQSDPGTPSAPVSAPRPENSPAATTEPGSPQTRPSAAATSPRQLRIRRRIANPGAEQQAATVQPEPVAGPNPAAPPDPPTQPVDSEHTPSASGGPAAPGVQPLIPVPASSAAVRPASRPAALEVLPKFHSHRRSALLRSERALPGRRSKSAETNLPRTGNQLPSKFVQPVDKAPPPPSPLPESRAHRYTS